MTEINFLDWFRNLFIPHLPQKRPVLLMIDGHESHVKYEVRQLAIEHKIELAKLPAHTTHILQPLDVAVMKPLKCSYDQAAHTLFLKERQYIKKTDFPKLIGQAWKGFKPQYAVNSLKKTGIMPLSHHAINNESLMPSRALVTTGTQQQQQQPQQGNDIENDGSGNETDMDELRSDPMYGESLVEQLNKYENDELMNEIITSEGPSSSTAPNPSTSDQCNSSSSEIDPSATVTKSHSLEVGITHRLLNFEIVRILSLIRPVHRGGDRG